jgi:hypothetical protein
LLNPVSALRYLGAKARHDRVEDEWIRRSSEVVQPICTTALTSAFQNLLGASAEGKCSKIIVAVFRLSVLAEPN